MSSTMFLFLSIIEPILLLFFFGMILGWVKKSRKESVIIIDFDTLVDVSSIIERGKIWAENNEDNTFDDYFAGHVTEQIPNPRGLVKALYYQQKGFTLHFVSVRPERLRMQTAKFLNDWKLRGQLHMINDRDEDMLEFIECKDEIKQEMYDYIMFTCNVAGIIDEKYSTVERSKNEK